MKKIFGLLFIGYASIYAQLPSYLNPNLNYGSVTDVDGNTYATIAIGTQVWMAENLRTSKYSNGSPIPNITDGNQWANMTSGACVSYNNDSSIDNPYGKLYNWYTTIDPRNLCPTGWHVSNEYDWDVLVQHLEPTANTFTVGTICNNCGHKIRTQSSNFWYSTNNNLQYNEFGFSALSSGNRIEPSNGTNYTFFGINGNYATYWTTNENTSTDAWGRTFQDFGFNCSIGKWNGEKKKRGNSVRCINDFPNSINKNNININLNLKTYPNIAEDFINVEYTLNEKENITISLLNIEGKPIKVFGNENQIAGFKRIFLDVTDIPSGIYMLKITGNRTNAHTKIIKQ